MEPSFFVCERDAPIRKALRFHFHPPGRVPLSTRFDPPELPTNPTVPGAVGPDADLCRILLCYMSSPAPVTSLRTPDRTPFLFTVNMGLEDVVVNEYRERAAAADLTVTDTDDAPFGLQSYALVEVEADPDAALDVARQMRSVHHVLAPLYTFSLPGDGEAALRTVRTTVESLDVAAMETADTFRVTSVRQGDHDFTSMDVQRVAGGGLDARYDAAVDLEDYDVEVRVDVHDDRCLVSVQHTREALSRRQLVGYQPRAALKANVAYALLRLAHLDTPPDPLLDPFCGSGTILLEAADLWPETQCYGNDWDEEAVAGPARTSSTPGSPTASRSGRATCGTSRRRSTT